MKERKVVIETKTFTEFKSFRDKFGVLMDINVTVFLKAVKLYERLSIISNFSCTENMFH
jgi:hypothetical protein